MLDETVDSRDTAFIDETNKRHIVKKRQQKLNEMKLFYPDMH